MSLKHQHKKIKANAPAEIQESHKTKKGGMPRLFHELFYMSLMLRQPALVDRSEMGDTDSFNFDTPAIDLGALTIDSMFLRDKEQKITLFAGMGMEDALLHLGEDAWQIKERLQNVADYERLFGEGLQNRGIMIENPSLSGQQGPAAVA